MGGLRKQQVGISPGIGAGILWPDLVAYYIGASAALNLDELLPPDIPTQAIQFPIDLRSG